MRAELTVENSSLVRAWVAEELCGAGAELALAVDGQPIWYGRARRLEHPGFDTQKPRTPCGLRVTLPQPRTRPHWVSVTLLANGRDVASTVVDLSARYIGSVDHIDLERHCVIVRGWVNDTSRHLEAVRVEFRAGDRVLRSGLANLHRPDLVHYGVGRGKHGFHHRIDALPPPWTPADIIVCVAGTSVEVPRHEAVLQALPSAAGPAAPGDQRPPLRASARVQLAAIHDARPEAKILGTCDKITDRAVAGWALDPSAPHAPVVLDLMFDNVVVSSATTDRFRRDIAEKFGSDGWNGFVIELPPQMWLGRHVRVSIVTRTTGQPLDRGSFEIKPSFSRTLPSSRGDEAALLSHLVLKPHCSGTGRPRETPVTLVVLNRNGGALLDRHFDSFARHNTLANVSHLVVDHHSADETLEVIERWRGKGLRVRLIPRDHNYSFSSSNNLAAQHAEDGDLVFINNDVFFCADVLPAVQQALHATNVGAVGVRLLDDADGQGDYAENKVQHLGVHFNTCRLDRVVHPVESRFSPQFRAVSRQNFRVPAVTGAFLAMSRDDFLRVGGFCEDFFYGYEDIDLCLKVRFSLAKDIVLVGQSEAVHFRGHSRKNTNAWSGPSMERNRKTIAARCGARLRRTLRTGVCDDHAYWTATRPVIAFAVTEAAADTAAGDFFTAYELAVELRKAFDASVVFLEEKVNWYNIHDVDILVAMTHNYDLSRIKDRKQNLLTIGWARNWFTEWAKPSNWPFDILFSSSATAANLLHTSPGYPRRILRIATNPQRFTADGGEARDIDYAFTGNFWGHSRDLIYLLEPAALPYSCAIFGSGWDNVPSLAPYSRGPVPYDELPALYRRARVIIDDANSVTKAWGSANSRVFDALSAGALVITNSPEVSHDAFDGKLPWFTTSEELESLLHRFCADETARLAALAPLQHAVREQHTYQQRASVLMREIRSALPAMLTIALKVPCPSEAEADAWGDFHLARSIAKELRRLGHSVRIDFLHAWHDRNRLRDDVSICFRGLSTYQPTADQINLLWLISHPDLISIGELRRYDKVYVASETFCRHLQAQGLTHVETLLQCTDTDMFHGDVAAAKDYDVLFVGNTRGVYRHIVRDALAIGVPLRIVGSGWESFVPEDFILSEHVANSDLPRLYASARVVLNDHWDSMRENGFISNRLFDCVATGTRVITDHVEGIEPLFGDLVRIVRHPGELGAAIRQELDRSKASQSEAARRDEINASHSAAARAMTMSHFLTSHYDRICRERAHIECG